MGDRREDRRDDQLNLDLTYNTDFAQVEVDEQQVNLTRFNLLFPEKRPFFLENRGLFAVGKNGEIDLFFSRRIGITDSGALVPIRGGARLTGKAGGVNVGLLDMQTEAVGNTPANNFGRLRVAKDLPNRSSVGAIFVNRTATGSGAGARQLESNLGRRREVGYWRGVDDQRICGAHRDAGRVGPRACVQFRCSVPDAQAAHVLRIHRGRRKLQSGGRVPRARGRVPSAVHRLVRERPDEESDRAWHPRVAPHYNFEGFWGFDGFQETATLHMDNAWDFENGNFISPAVNIQCEGLREPFEVYPGVIVPPGSYRSPLAAGMGNTDRRKWISASTNIGGFLSGHQKSVAPQLNIRSGSVLTTSLRWTRNDIDLPQGAFVTNLGSFGPPTTSRRSSTPQR